MTASPFKAIVFDFDGVIVDSEPLHYQAFVQLAQQQGVTIDQTLYDQHLIGFDDRDALRAIESLKHQGPPEPHPDYPVEDAVMAELCATKQHIFNQLVAQGVTPLPGVDALVRKLIEQATPFAIASGATREDIDLILQTLGWSDRFDIIVTADDVEHSKPDPTTYQLAVQKLAAKHPELSLTPGDCLAIEDTVAGLTSAQRAGLHTLATGPAATSTPPAKANHHRATLENLDLAELA